MGLSLLTLNSRFPEIGSAETKDTSWAKATPVCCKYHAWGHEHTGRSSLALDFST